MRNIIMAVLLLLCFVQCGRSSEFSFARQPDKALFEKNEPADPAELFLLDTRMFILSVKPEETAQPNAYYECTRSQFP